MSAGFVRVATDSTGKKLQTFENVLGADDVHAEAVVLVDSAGAVVASWPVTGTFWQATQPVSGTVASTQSGTWTVQPGNTANTTAWKVDGSAFTQPVSGTFWQSTQPVSIASTVTTKESRSGTAATTQVADTAVNATLLASNANRLGATIQNDSSAVLYVKLGTTATVTDYTVRLVQYSYFELPFGYTGRIDGIWATDPNDGAARITELT